MDHSPGADAGAARVAVARHDVRSHQRRHIYAPASRQQGAQVATSGASDGHEPRVSPVPVTLDRTAQWSWRLLVIGLAVYAGLILLARLSVVMLPLFIAIVLATLCVPPAQRLQRRGVPDGVAAAIVVIGGLTALVALLAALAPGFVEEIGQLRPTVEDGIDSLLVQLETFGYDQDRLTELLEQARSQLSGSSSAILTGLAGGVAAALSGLAGLALLVVLLFFFVKDAEDITTWMVSRLPERHRDGATAVGRRAWQALSGYVRGTAAIAAIDAIAIGIGLAIIGVPLVLPLAVLVFLGAFLPVVGALLAGLIAVLVALADGGLQTAAIVLVLIVAVQQVEGNVLQPMIMRRAVALHPVVVLTALAIGATLAGIVGAFLSLPIAAVLAAVGNELRLRSEGAADDTSTVGDAQPT